MCGRYTITVDTDALSDRFGCIIIEKLGGPRYNMAPQQMAPVVTRSHGQNKIQLMKWGLVPFWAKESSIGSRMINARWETLQEKPAFKHLLRRKRCLVPADGYYEWQKVDKQKRPFRIVLPSSEVFALAGLWDEWMKPDGDILTSFTIITTEAAPSVSLLHERMPFIIPKSMEGQWLDDGISSKEDMAVLLAEFHPAQELVAYPVSTMVNLVNNDSPECIVLMK